MISSSALTLQPHVDPLLYLLLAISLLLGDPALEVQVTRLDESTVAGTVRQWDSAAVELNTGGEQPQELPLEDVLRIDLQIDHDDDNATGPPVELQLVDGSRLGAGQFASGGGTCSIEGAVVRSRGSSDPLLEVPLDAVRAVRLQPLPPDRADLESQWREIIASRPTGDLIVIRKADAERLSYVEGALGNVGRERVQFTLDDQTLDVDRQRVFGLVYYRANRDTADTAPLVLGPEVQLPAEQVSWSDGALHVETQYLGRVEVPIEAVASVDYSRDRLQYLSDLEPLRAEWTPPPAAAPVDSLFASVARDRGFYDADLTLEFPATSLPEDQTTSAGLGQRVTYRKGLAIRSRTEIAYRVPSGFQWFRATAGIDPQTRRTGQVELIIGADGKQLWSGTIDGSTAPEELQCAIDGVEELTIVVDYGSDGRIDVGTGDNLHLAAARFTK